MADSTIPALSLPHFPQVFTQALDAMVSRTYCPAVCSSDSADEYGTICGQLVRPGAQFCSEHALEAERG